MLSTLNISQAFFFFLFRCYSLNPCDIISSILTAANSHITSLYTEGDLVTITQMGAKSIIEVKGEARIESHFPQCGCIILRKWFLSLCLNLFSCKMRAVNLIWGGLNDILGIQ